jgi:hypothetical protein
LLDIPPVRNELDWLSTHLYCSGLDKADNNACFIYVKHIRLQALECLTGSDFTPCKDNSLWTLSYTILDQVSEELKQVLPESPPPYQALPYLMATYKQHKTKYRWLTNAYCTVFSNIALLLTIASKLVLHSFKGWASSKLKDYKTFLQVNTSFFWIVDSIIDTTLNLPVSISDIFVVDISRCYETNPLEGPDNLSDAITFITITAFKQAALDHPRATTYLWIRLAPDGTLAATKWCTHCPQYGQWLHFTTDRLIHLHKWLMSNCYITLGDRVWRQKTGTPMGFSCSPIWCSMYLLSYETKFLQRLARLGRMDLMSKFRHTFRYIDDLCMLNMLNPWDFLSPLQPRTEENPFWIYPLDKLEIKEETTAFSPNNPGRGVAAHFMNAEFCVNEAAPESFTFCKFDKRCNLPFPYT